MMFMMWYAAQQRQPRRQQLKKIDNASNNGISIADDNDDRYRMHNCKDKISQCIYNSTMTIYYADDTIVTYDNAIAKIL